LEWFDEELDFEPGKAGIFTLDELQPETAGPREMIGSVKGAIANIIRDKKFPLMLGGEHSITAGAIEAFKEEYGSDFSILQFDAHTDLREEFEGSKFNHACVMRRAFDLGQKITQVGIRSICREDIEFIGKNKSKIKTYYAKDMENWDIKDLINGLNDNIYVTFDIDAFDSGIMPATGTPEPGGLDWKTATSILNKVSKEKKIIGADVVELLPTPGLHACDFLAAKLAYKIIGYAFRNEK
jgi:agmatinase